MKHPHSLKKQAGLTLTESLLVLAVAALVAVLAYAGYKLANQNVKSASAVDASARLLSTVKKTFGSSGKYTGLTTLALAQSGVVPTEYTVSTADTGTITAPWGKTVTAAVNASDATIADVTFNTLPSDICMDLLAGIEGFSFSMKVGTTVIKDSGTPYNVGTAAAQCATAGGPSVVVQVK